MRQSSQIILTSRIYLPMVKIYKVTKRLAVSRTVLRKNLRRTVPKEQTSFVSPQPSPHWIVHITQPSPSPRREHRYLFALRPAISFYHSSHTAVDVVAGASTYAKQRIPMWRPSSRIGTRLSTGVGGTCAGRSEDYWRDQIIKRVRSN